MLYAAERPPDTAALSSAALQGIQHVNLGPLGALTRPQIAAGLAGAPAGAAHAAVSAQGDLDDAYNKMVDYCHATLDRFEGRADRLAYWSAAVAVIGSLAGSVAVPALAVKGANKAWTAALGGISGASNAGQQSLNGAGLNAAAQLQSRQDVLTSWKADIAPYYDSKQTLDVQRLAVAKAFADCQLYQISTSPGK